MYPDLLGQFIMTLVEKGCMVSINRDPIIDGISIHVIKCESKLPYHAVRTMAFDTLNSMTKDAQKAWFDYFIKWAEVEFLNLKQGEKND